VGARNILLSISWGEDEITLDEMHGIVNYIQEQTRTAGDTNIIWGAGRDASLGDQIEVTIVATGFQINEEGLWSNDAPVRSMVAPPDRVTEDATLHNSCDEESAQESDEEQQPRKPRFQPPVGERDPHAFWEKGATPSPATTAEPRLPHAVASGNVIELKENDIYKNLKQIEETPSYIRRAARIVTDTPGKASRSVIKEDPAPEQQLPQGNSLFD
jgi:cell division protein FtsZ